MNIRDYLHALPLALGIVVAGCGDDPKATPDAAVPPVDAPPVVPPAVTLSPAGALGPFLQDSTGKTLYFYVNDVAASNATACTGGCLTNWPVFDVQAPTVGPGLVATDFSRFASHTTWRTRPLYRFANDTAATPTAGENVGGRWFVARAYNLFVAANAAVTPEGAAAANAPFLTNGAGRSVYVFQDDTRGVGATPPVSKCTGQCLVNWPLWEKPAALTTPVVPSTITATDLTSFDNGGKQQFAYKGWPLYFFAADDVPGKVAGDAVAKWHAVSPAWDGTFPAPAP
jgi:predicted lipoprotein with Yx(FWY)xxD motif